MSEGKIRIDGSDPQRLAIDGTNALNECVERLFLACQSIIMVRAPRLDLDFYFSDTFTECCRSIMVRDMRNQLQFLVEDEQYIMKMNVRLVALARQFSTYIKVRVIPEEYIEHQEMFIVCDATGYLHQPSAEYPKGFMGTSDPGTARQLSQRFKDLWERSTPPAELFTAGL